MTLKCYRNYHMFNEDKLLKAERLEWIVIPFFIKTKKDCYLTMTSTILLIIAVYKIYKFKFNIVNENYVKCVVKLHNLNPNLMDMFNISIVVILLFFIHVTLS